MGKVRRTLGVAACSVVAAIVAVPGASAGQAGRSPVKVFILAGQSNMEGQGLVKPGPNHIKRNGGKGTLEYLVKDSGHAATFRHLVDDGGKWRVRDDVWIWYLERTAASRSVSVPAARPSAPSSSSAI